MSATSAKSIITSLGIHQMWGLSPTFNLLENITGVKNSDSSTINILLLCPGDIRHVLDTISKRFRYSNRSIQIFIHENNPEVLARHLLLLQIVHDWEIPIRHRCNLFLEVYGNSLVQERTSKYIAKKGKELISLVYDSKGAMEELIDFECLKMKSRDDLVDVFRSWMDDKSPSRVQTLREHRLRNFYENRFDFRKNVVDWDYSMNLKTIEGASIIHHKQYREWRERGVAFEFGDQTYTMDNKSMLSFAQMYEKGQGNQLRKGYWLDIISSPYISFGLDCYKSNEYAKDLFKILNKGSGAEQHRHNAVEVAVYNILSYLYEIETGEIYEMKREHEIYSGIGDDNAVHTEASTVEEIKNGIYNIDPLSAKKEEEEAIKRANQIMKTMSNVKISLLTGSSKDLFHRKKYLHKFDHVFLSNQAAHLLQPPEENQSPATKGCFLDILSNECLISVESSVFMIQLKKEQRRQYMEKVDEYALKMNLKRNFSFIQKIISEEDVEDKKKAVLQYIFQREVN